LASIQLASVRVAKAPGNLTALLGTVGPDAGYKAGEYADPSSALEAAVDMFGPTDLTDPTFIATSLIALLARELEFGSSAASLRLRQVPADATGWRGRDGLRTPSGWIYVVPAMASGCLGFT
jgi:hypothetical protein